MDPTSIIYMAPAISPIQFDSGVDWAAWVQAIGSVAAICFAVWLQNRQRKHDIADQQSIDAQKTRAVGIRVFVELRKARNEIMEKLDLAKKERARPVKFLIDGPSIFTIGTYPIIDEVFRSWEALSASPESFQQFIHQLRLFATTMSYQSKNWEEITAVDATQAIPQNYIELASNRLAVLLELVDASIKVFEEELRSR